jgi:WD40 repeat protein
VRKKQSTQFESLFSPTRLASSKTELKIQQSAIDFLKKTISDKDETIATLINENNTIREELAIRDRIISDLKRKLRDMPEKVDHVPEKSESTHEEEHGMKLRHQSAPNMRLLVDRNRIQKDFHIDAVLPPKLVQYQVDLETQVNDLKFSSDSQTIAIACNDKTVKLYDTKAGICNQTLTGALEQYVIIYKLTIVFPA